MKKYIILCVLPVFFGFKTGREIDEKKMNRDLEISKNILATLIKSGSDLFLGGESIEASYIQDYGVVFTIPEHLVYFHSKNIEVIAIPDMPPMPDLDIGFYGDFDLSEDINEEQIKKQKIIIKEHEKEVKKHREELEKSREEMEKAREDMERAREEAVVELRNDGVYRIKTGPGQEDEIDWEEIMVTFMTDYADLIGQLQPDERIVIKQKSPYTDHMLIWNGKRSNNEPEEKAPANISAMVRRKDVSEYKAGKINKDTFVSRIEITKKEPNKKIADLEMFANIFDRYYSSDLTETFYSQGVPSYELLEGFGVIFQIKAASHRGTYRIKQRSAGSNTWSAVTPEQVSDDLKNLYAKFKEDLKAFMLDYGRTIRSLKDDDTISLKIKLSSCRDCKIPKSMEVSTKMSVLKQYDQQKLSRDKALARIEIKEKI